MYFLIPLLNLLLLQLSFKLPPLIYFSGFVLLFLIFFSIRKWFKVENKKNSLRSLADLKQGKSSFWLIYSSISLFVVSFLILLVFLENKTLISALIVLETFGLFIFLYVVYHIFKTQKIKLNYAVQNVVGYFNLVSFFCFTADLLFLDLNTTGKFFYFFSFFALAIFILAVLSLKIYDVAIWQSAKPVLLYLLVLEIIMLELFWVLGYWPIAVYTRAGVLALCFYFIMGMFRHYLLWGIKEITFKVVKRYVIISSIGTILLLATARWR